MFPTNSLPKKLYLIGVVVIFLAVYSQYFIRYGSITGYLVVYGIPVLVVSLLFGRQLLHRAGKNNKDAAKFGLGLFGVLIVISLLLSIIALAIITHFDPHAANLLNKPNPVLNVPSNVAWLMIPVSILVVGPAEEYLFRGFIYGGLLSISKGRYWIPVGGCFKCDVCFRPRLLRHHIRHRQRPAVYRLNNFRFSHVHRVLLVRRKHTGTCAHSWRIRRHRLSRRSHHKPNWPSCTTRDDICRHRVCSSLPSQKNRHAPNA